LNVSKTNKYQCYIGAAPRWKLHDASKISSSTMMHLKSLVVQICVTPSCLQNKVTILIVDQN